MVHIIVAKMRRAVVRLMVHVLNTITVVVKRIVSTLVVVARIGVPPVVMVTGEKAGALGRDGHAMDTVGTAVVDVHLITKLLTLAATPIVGVNRITLVLVRALQHPQLIPSAQLHAQFNV